MKNHWIFVLPLVLKASIFIPWILLPLVTQHSLYCNRLQEVFPNPNWIIVPMDNTVVLIGIMATSSFMGGFASN